VTKRIEVLKPGAYSSAPDTVLCRKDLSPVAKLVYQALLSHLHTGGPGHVRAGVNRLSRLTGLHRTAVLRAIDRLWAAKLIAILERPGRTNLYYFLDPDPGQNPTSR